MGVQVSWNNSTDLGWHAAVVCVKHVCLLRLYSSQQREEREEEEKHLIHSEGLASSTKKKEKTAGCGIKPKRTHPLQPGGIEPAINRPRLLLAAM